VRSLRGRKKKSKRKYGKPDAVKVACPVCAVRRVVVSLLEAGGIEEVSLGYQSTRM